MKRAAVTALCFMFAGALLAAATSHYNIDVRLGQFEELENKTVDFEGVVTDVHYDAGRYAVYAVDISNAMGLSDFSCVFKGEGGVSPNSIIKGRATFYPLEKSETFDERRYYLSQGIIMSAETVHLEYVGEDGFSLHNEANKLNRNLSYIFYDLLGEDAGGFAAALILGNKENLPKAVSRDFQRLGLSHILAISGMHLTIICAFVSTLLYPFGKNAGRIGCIFTVIFYMIITGFSASVTRSGIMLLVLILSAFLRRGGDSFTNLGIAVFLISIIDPFACSDIGLQLSFCAVFAILLYLTKRKPLTEAEEDKKELKNPFLKLLRSLFEASVLTVVVVLFMLPLEWLYFGEISLISPLTSPLFSLFATVLLWTLPILLLLSPAHTISALLAYPIKGLIDFIILLAGKLSVLRNITASLNYPFAFCFCVLIFIGIVAFCASKKKKRLIFGAVTLLLVFSFGLSCFVYKLPDKDRATISMLEHKQSDGLLIFSENKAMVIDIGNGYSKISDLAVNALSSGQATEIEVLMLTHIHTSHPATLQDLFSSKIVRTVVLPKEEGEAYYDTVEVCKANNVPYVEYICGDTVSFADCKIKTYKSEYIKRSTQPIIRLDIKAFDEQFTYLGAAYVEGLPTADLSDSDHVLFGGHGPRYKSTFSPTLSDSCKIYTTEISEIHLSKEYVICNDEYVILD